jgi:simple sugar transport system substrate-binding protein
MSRERRLLAANAPARWVAAAAALVLLLAACGDASDEALDELDGTTDENADADEGVDEADEESEAEAADDEVIQVAFVGESSSTDVIWNYGAEVMREVAGTLNIEFVDRYADGDFARQAEMIEQEIARGVDGIIAPFFDSSLDASIRNAIDQGVAVYAIIGVPALEESELDQIGYAETSWYEVGRLLGEITLPEIGDDAKILWPAEVPSGSYITEAVRGFEDVADEQGRTVTIEVLDASSDPSTSASRQLSYLTSNPDTDAVVTSGAIAIEAANTAMRQGGREPGNPPLFGQVTNPSSVRGIQEGYMTSGVWIDQQMAATTAMEVIERMIRDGAPGEHSVVSLTVITEDNVEDVIPAELFE